MKKTILTIALIALVVVSLIVLTGCESKSSKPIVGSWAYNGGSDYIYTFKEDNTGSYSAYGNEREFTYEDDGSQVSILYNGDTTAGTYEYTIDGNKLIIKDSFGNDVEYVKK